jgi:hypothetical protein
VEPHPIIGWPGRSHPLTKKVRLLTLRRSNNGHQLWGNASKDWARAALGGTNEPAALSSVFGVP